MRRTLRPHLFHIYAPEEHHFGCPEGLYTKSWVVRMDAVDKILLKWVCPTCLRAMAFATHSQAQQKHA
jgi:hypothetical protein